MKNRLKRDRQAVSPVIATILMVAITVVLAATLYMMLPTGSDTDTTTAMSGRIDKTDDGWLIQIDGGSVQYSEDILRLYNKNTGVVENNFTEDDNDDFSDNDNTPGDGINYIFNDNDGNGDINNGDTFRIEDSNHWLRNDYEFQIEDTSLALEFAF